VVEPPLCIDPEDAKQAQRLHEEARALRRQAALFRHGFQEALRALRQDLHDLRQATAQRRSR